MGAFLDKPKTQKFSEEGNWDGKNFSVSCMQGWRIDMEDAHRIVFPLPGKLSEWVFCAIFDGHAGSKVAEEASKRLIDKILDQDEFKQLKEDASLHMNKELIKRGIVEGFLKFDDQLIQDNKDEKSGSTAVVAFITPKMIILANCGDSRAIVASNDHIVLETVDHKPGDANECDRITKAGGSVVLQRINGALAVSRSLGDFEYKRNTSLKNTQQLVTAEPDVTFYDRNIKEDQFLFLACDGIWDVFTSEVLRAYLTHRLHCEESYAKVTEQLLDHCLHLGSRDNMSALLIGLDSSPKLNPEMRNKDRELNKTIASIVHKYFRDNPEPESFVNNRVYDMFEGSDINFQEIPGGLPSKRYIIESIVSKYNPTPDEDTSPEVMRITSENYDLNSYIDPSKAVPYIEEELS